MLILDLLVTLEVPTNELEFVNMKSHESKLILLRLDISMGAGIVYSDSKI